MLSKKNAKQIIFLDFGLFWSFFNQKTAKIDKNEENWQNPNRLMKFSEIWYVDASQLKKMLQKNFSGFRPFWPFLTKKQPKLTKNEENWQNPNHLMKFSEIWNEDDFQQKNKCYKYFVVVGFWPFLVVF